jgi:hypothetical protein
MSQVRFAREMAPVVRELGPQMRQFGLQIIGRLTERMASRFLRSVGHSSGGGVLLSCADALSTREYVGCCLTLFRVF